MRTLRRDKTHMTGIAATLIISPGHEKLASRRIRRHPAGATT
jgi:hypothetical protein